MVIVVVNNLGNKVTMSQNIQRLMKEKGVTATEVCKVLGFPNATFSDWINAKTYPRIDKIEKMAIFFGVEKVDLVEEPDSLYRKKDPPSDLSAEEQALVRCWRQATDKERQNIAFILRDYGMPFPQAEPEAKLSRSSG